MFSVHWHYKKIYKQCLNCRVTLFEQKASYLQLIHNGYGGFIFLNPFAKVLKMWGLRDLSKLVYNAHTLYLKYHNDIECECTDEEFMAMFEKYPEFDDIDDEFVENEEEWTSYVAAYIDDHSESFAKIGQGLG